MLFRPISQQEDFTILQRDIMAIEQWVLDNHLTFNTSKCSNMMLSRKRFPITLLHPLMLNGLHLNKVSWYTSLLDPTHIRSVCSKAKQILGLLYRRFYNHTEGATHMLLYLSLIRPHLKYACPVWDPHTMKDKVRCPKIRAPDGHQTMGLWIIGNSMNVPSLADRRLQLKFALLVFMVCTTSH